MINSTLQLLAEGTKQPESEKMQKILPIILIVVLMVVMVVIQVLSSRKRKKQAEKFSQTLKAGSIVMTRSGLIGEIIGFDDAAGTVVLNIARNKEEKFEITVVKGAIDRIIPPEHEAAKSSNANLTSESKPVEEQKKEATPTTEDEVEAEKLRKEKAEKKALKKEKNKKEVVEAEIVEKK